MLTFARLLLALLVFLPSYLRAQSTQTGLEARLLHKPLLLRGFWGKDKLHFDAVGNLLGDHTQLPFTLCGISVEKVQLTPGKLVLDGRRVGISFHDDERDPIELTTGSSHSPERMHLEIDGAANYEPALHTIFADSLAELTPTLPAFWQRYALAHFPEHPDAAHSTPFKPSAAKIDGNVKPPRLIHPVEPSFSEAARQMGVSGDVLVNLIVNEKGGVGEVNIVRPVGIGLDEPAVAAVMRYIFKPAMRDGKPIAVELNIDVHFQVF